MVVVGAGPTGVELAGQIRELAVRCLKGEFRTFDPASVQVVLLDAGDKALAPFGDKLSADAAAMLAKGGVDLQLGSQVVGVDVGGADVRSRDGTIRRIEARTVLWAAGVQASPLAGKLAEACGVTVDRSGRIPVQPDLSLPGHPEVFALGDMTTLDHLPGVAEVAMQGGLHAANSILRRQRGEEVLPFKYRDVGSVATIGRFQAVSSIRKLHLKGFPALDRLVLRAPGLPHRLRRPVLHHAAVAPFDGRPRPRRAGDQQRPHRWRPQPPRGRAPGSATHPLPRRTPETRQ